jgi:ferric-dicitrate binding protein FerR (iron transport regulator)
VVRDRSHLQRVGSASDGRAAWPNLPGLADLARQRLTGESPKRNAASLESVQGVLARRQRRRALFGLAACCVAAIVAVPCLLVAANGGEALRVSVQSSGSSEPGRDDAIVHFSDGSEIALGAGALVRIEALTSRGAELALEHGVAKLDVAERPGARWRLRAGGYQIQGSGASFDVDLDAERHALSIALSGGSLSVSGPAIQQELELESGERLSIELDQSRVHVERRPPGAGCSKARGTAAEGRE